jgi:hypothetical protein
LIRLVAIRFLAALALVIVVLAATPSPAETWRPMDRDGLRKKSFLGYCNCVFSTQEIPKGKEKNITLLEKFTRPDPVFARCYFPEKIGPVRAEDFWHEIWIDGRLTQFTRFNKPPPPDWDQVAVWITAEDYADEMKALGPGEHEIVIWVLKNSDPGPRTNSEPFLPEPKRLSRGRFIYIVPEE